MHHINTDYQPPDNVMVSCLEDLSRWAKSQSKTIAQNKKGKLEKWINKVEQIKSQQSHNSNDLANYVQQIEELIQEKTKAAAFRSKAKYDREYEKNSRFFFSLEKSNYNKK